MVQQMQLTVREVCELLKVSENKVQRWIKEMGLPHHRVQGQYRFNRSELFQWASQRRISVPPEAVMATPAGESAAPPGLVDSLEAGGIYHQLAATDKESALRSAVGVMPLPPEMDREFLLRTLLARESLQSTGVGEGIAIPHARNPAVLKVNRPTIMLCFLARPVEFGALDGKPVHALFTLVSATVQTHLHLLARIAFALRDPLFKKAIISQAAKEIILAEARRVEGLFRSGAATAGGRER